MTQVIKLRRENKMVIQLVVSAVVFFVTAVLAGFGFGIGVYLSTKLIEKLVR